MKKCAKCEIIKGNSYYHKDNNNKDGFYRWCKSCKKEYDKIYRQSDKVQDMYSSEEYRLKKSKYRELTYEKTLFNSSKHRAKNCSIEFNIEESDIIIPEYCPLLGVKLVIKLGNGLNPYSPSIDRIDNNLGYTKNNIWVISRLANTMKSYANKEELIEFSTNILNYFKQ